jgi:hypothetical protein
METLAEIEPTREAIAQYLRDQWGGLGYDVEAKNITLEPYGWDNRIPAETYLVVLDGYAVAFTDTPILPDLPESSAPSVQPAPHPPTKS